MVKENQLCKRKGDHLYSIRFKRIKDLPSIRGYHSLCAKNKEVAKRKFKRTSVFRRQKILNVVEIK